MALTLKLTTVGDATGVIFPVELLEKLRVKNGDLLHVLETADGINLTPVDQMLAQQMDVAETVMRSRRTLLSKLAE